MGQYTPRCGLTSSEVRRLSGRWRNMDGKENWPDLDSFVEWAAKKGYRRGMRTRKWRPYEPHSPDNSYFADSYEIALQEQEERRNEINAKCEFCEQCTEKCNSMAVGCLRWREYFVSNWNNNIRRARTAAEEKPIPVSVGPQYFRYEHPDLVREGIVFRGKTEE